MKQPSGLSRALFQFQKLVLGLSFLLCLAVGACYLIRPDSFAAVTIFPVWAWLGPGLFLAALGWGYRTRRAAVVVALIWLGYLGVFAEEPRSLLRFGQWPTREWEAAREQGRGLRVVSLNSRVAEQAAAEVAQYHPDIVLLQESPPQKQVKRVAAKLFGDQGEFLWSSDVSIIVRGSLALNPVPTPKHLVLARVRLKSGIEANVISTRLHSPVFGAELWSLNCWQEQAENRRKHRAEMERTKALLAALPESVPIIIGGDFNSPAGDAIYRLLKPRLHDTFAEAGRGWGNTAFNHLPVLRVDEVWTSDHFRALAVVARETINSDHRLVVCDLMVR